MRPARIPAKWVKLNPWTYAKRRQWTRLEERGLWTDEAVQDVLDWYDSEEGKTWLDKHGA